MNYFSTAIGDFAEGVPFEEWLHWKQYAVEPPSLDTARSLAQEQPVPEAVNALARALQELNTAFAGPGRLVWCDNSWRPVEWFPRQSGRSSAKVGLPATANDDEFLKRATPASTLLLDGLQTVPLRSSARSR